MLTWRVFSFLEFLQPKTNIRTVQEIILLYTMCDCICVCACVCVRAFGLPWWWRLHFGGGDQLFRCETLLSCDFFCVEVASYFAHKQSFRVWEIPTITFACLVVEHNFFLCFASYFFPLWRNSGLLNSSVYGFIVSPNALVSVYCRHTKYSYTSFPFIQLSQVSLQ